MLSDDRLISVIIPTYKGSKSLRRTIQSVLDQSYKNIEIIVVDDNDPDTEERKLTEELIRSFGDWHGGYTENGMFNGSGEYDHSGLYVGPNPNAAEGEGTETENLEDDSENAELSNVNETSTQIETTEYTG